MMMGDNDSNITAAGKAENFLRMIKEMEGRGERTREIMGDIEGPFFSRAVYGCVVRIGLSNPAEKFQDR